MNEGVKYPDNYPDVREEFLYRWGLTALFHDIGYPVELINKSLAVYLNSAVALGPRDAKKSGKPVIALSIEELDDLIYVNQLWPATHKIKDISF